MRITKIKLINFVYEIEKIVNESWYATLGFCLALSWIYAISAQCCIPLPCNPVPFTMQGITFLFFAWLFGKTAVLAYVFYLLQGIAGAPFFSHFGSGFVHLLGPTGGYLIGFLFSMIFMASLKNFAPNSQFALLFKYWIGMLICFAFGLAQLSFFVPANKVLIIGFYPFIICDFIIKALLMLLLASRFKR